MLAQPWFDGLAGDVFTAIVARERPRTAAVAEANGLLGWDATFARIALAVQPLPLSVGSVLARHPYTSPDLIAFELAESAGRGVLQPGDGDTYGLTEDARHALALLAQSVRESADELAPIVPGGCGDLASDLEGVATACARHAPFDTPCLDGSRFLMAAPGAPPLLRVRHAIVDLFAFRDDAHYAAWQGLAVTGPEWEALSHVWGANVWGSPVRTLDALAEKLAFRGYDRDDYARTLGALVARGWVLETEGQLALTPEGLETRERVEAVTDRTYFEAWPLDETGAARLRTGLETLRDALAAARP